MITQKNLQLIQKIAARLASKYTFGYYDIEDIKQEAIIIGLDGLSIYDPNISSLATFLRHHINNRLKNFLRDNHYRRRPICPQCGSKEYSSECDSCTRYQWQIEIRKNLIKPLPIDLIEENEKGIQVEDDISNIENAELLSIIDRDLPVSLRSDYLKLKDDVPIPYGRRIRLLNKLREIIGEENG